MLWSIVEEYASAQPASIAHERLSTAKEAGLATLKIAWAGSDTIREPHYYRIQGPTFLIEYDNTQNGANHVHYVVRDLRNDFGEDLLRQHYEQHHKK